MELLFPRDEQRVLFNFIDRNQSGELDINEFKSFFSVDSCGLDCMPRDILASGQPSTSPQSSTSPANKKLDLKLVKIKDHLTEKIFAKRRCTKMSEGREYASQQLLEAFRQMDTDMSGYLTRDELYHALGPKYLNLGITRADVS